MTAPFYVANAQLEISARSELPFNTGHAAFVVPGQSGVALTENSELARWPAIAKSTWDSRRLNNGNIQESFVVTYKGTQHGNRPRLADLLKHAETVRQRNASRDMVDIYFMPSRSRPEEVYTAVVVGGSVTALDSGILLNRMADNSGRAAQYAVTIEHTGWEIYTDPYSGKIVYRSDHNWSNMGTLNVGEKRWGVPANSASRVRVLRIRPHLNASFRRLWFGFRPLLSPDGGTSDGAYFYPTINITGNIPIIRSGDTTLEGISFIDLSSGKWATRKNAFDWHSTYTLPIRNWNTLMLKSDGVTLNQRAVAAYNGRYRVLAYIKTHPDAYDYSKYGVKARLIYHNLTQETGELADLGEVYFDPTEGVSKWFDLGAVTIGEYGPITHGRAWNKHLAIDLQAALFNSGEITDENGYTANHMLTIEKIGLMPADNHVYIEAPEGQLVDPTMALEVHTDEFGQVKAYGLKGVTRAFEPTYLWPEGDSRPEIMFNCTVTPSEMWEAPTDNWQYGWVLFADSDDGRIGFSEENDRFYVSYAMNPRFNGDLGGVDVV